MKESQENHQEHDANKADDFIQNQEKNRVTYFAVWSALFVALAGSWQYGFSIGSFNSARLPAQNSIREQYETRWNASVSDSMINAIWVASSATFPAGGIFGSLLVGPVVKRLGRLHGLLFIHSITVVLSVLLGLSEVFQSPEVIVITRFGIGITSGIVTTGISIIYLVEISPKHVRGRFGGFVSAGITGSNLFGNILGLPQVLGNSRLWSLLFACTGLPSLLFVLLHKTLPKSPRKLYIEDNNKEKATKILRKLNGRENVNDILSEMQNEEEDRSKRQMTVKEVLFSRSLRGALVVAFMIGTAEQMTGLNGVSINLNDIYRQAGISESIVHYVSIGVLTAHLMSNLLGTFLVEKYGRRTLILSGYSGMGISLFLLTISMETQHLSSVMSYVSIAASIGFLLSFAVGPGPVTYPIIAEFFEQNARSAAVSLAVTTSWVGFTVTTIVTPYMLEAIRGYAFIPYGILAFLFVAYFWYKVPETKNKTFTEIKKAFQSTEYEETDTTIDEATL